VKAYEPFTKSVFESARALVSLTPPERELTCRLLVHSERVERFVLWFLHAFGVFVEANVELNFGAAFASPGVEAVLRATE
jgi:hypothetical protein